MSLWIVDRRPAQRAALTRLAGAAAAVHSGPPGAAVFDAAPAPSAVLVGLDGDWEPELEFAHAVRKRTRAARWVLVGERGAGPSALRAFDAIDAEFLPYPPDPDDLHRLLRAARSAGTAPPLSARAQRERLAERFASWFGDLDLPGVLRALDPAMAEASLLVRGEPGTGRGVIARYVHAFGGGGGALARVPCSEQTKPSELIEAIAAAARHPEACEALTVWLEDAERLPPSVQRILSGWIDYGLPPGTLRSPRVRWIASVDAGAPLDRGLRRVLSDLSVELPPLRERPHRVAAVAQDTARRWCEARAEPPRRFGEDARAVLEEYPWPGNLRELEALVVQTLAAGAGDPIRSDDLVCDGRAFSPLDVEEVGTLVSEATVEAEPPRPAEPAGGKPPEVRLEPDEAIPELEIDLEDLDALLTAGDAEPAPPPEAPRRPSERAPGEASLGRLVGALAHEVRNPLATIRTFAELLPERADDPQFRTRFAEVVSQDVGRIDALVERLGELAELAPPQRQPVDVSALLEGLLDERRQRIRERRLLVLKELDSGRPRALCDPEQLRFALEALLSKSLEMVPERGDVYLASRHHTSGSGGPTVRILLRFHASESSEARAAGLSMTENSLEFAMADLIVRAQGGSLAITSTDGDETVIVIDLPAL